MKKFQEMGDIRSDTILEGWIQLSSGLIVSQGLFTAYIIGLSKDQKNKMLSAKL